MTATPVYIVCSPRPQAGKTLVARLLSEFLLLKDGRVIAFDINLKEPSLLDYLPGITETAEIDAIREVLHTLSETLLIVVFVIFLFLGSFRSVLIPVVAIPISLLGGFLLMPRTKASVRGSLAKASFSDMAPLSTS